MNEIHDALGAYVVGALDAGDSAAFEQHLAGCATCRDEVVALGEAAAQLSTLAAAPPPPRELRAAVLDAIPDVRQLAARRTSAPVTDEHDHREVREDERFARRRADRRVRVLTLLVAAVSVLALALGGVVASLSHQQAPVAGAPADASLLSAPDARILPATLPDGTHVSFVVSRTQNRALFVARDLPSPGPGRVYELWTMRGGVPVPDNTMDGGADVSQWFHGSVSEAGGLAVTVEPVGGSRAPTTPVLASGIL